MSSVAPGGRLGFADGGTADTRASVREIVGRPPSRINHKLTNRRRPNGILYMKHPTGVIDVIGNPIPEPPRAHPPIVVGGGPSHEPPPRHGPVAVPGRIVGY